MMVWPALFPAEYLATIWAFSARRSTILPLPSSPHWPPTTTVTGILRGPLPPPPFALPKSAGSIRKEAGHGQAEAVAALPADVPTGRHPGSLAGGGSQATYRRMPSVSAVSMSPRTERAARDALLHRLPHG